MHIQRTTASKPRNTHDYKGVYRGKYVREETTEGREKWVWYDEKPKEFYRKLIQAYIEDKMPECPYTVQSYDSVSTEFDRYGVDLDNEEAELRDNIGVWFTVCAYQRSNGSSLLHGKKNKEARQQYWNIINSGNYTKEMNHWGVLLDVHKTDLE